MLQDAERVWREFRDRECAFETADTEAGTIHPMEVMICLEAMTRQRIRDLQRQLDCEEGDLTCVH